MNMLSTWVADLGYWAWFILALVLFFLELTAPGIYLLWLGFAAAVVGGILTVADLTWQWQIALFSVLSIVSVYLSRFIIKQSAEESEAPHLNQRARKYIGRECVLSVPIESGRGRVQLADTYWNVKGPDLPAGARVKVTGAEGALLIVEPVEQTT